MDETIDTEGLLLWLPRNVKSNWYDYSGEENDGLIYGATIAELLCEQCMSFNGESDYVQVPDVPPLRIQDEITLGFWVKPIETGMDNDAYFISKGTRYLLARHSDTTEVKGTVYVDGGWRHTPRIPWDNEVWNCFVVTYSSTSHEIKIYKNGEYKGKTTLSGLATYQIDTDTSALLIGGAITRHFKGSVGNVMVYNRVLTAEEARRVYEITKQYYGY